MAFLMVEKLDKTRYMTIIQLSKNKKTGMFLLMCETTMIQP